MKKILEFCRDHGITAETRVLAAVSGGADSMCLLSLLRSNGFSVSAAHFNHCLRGAESDGDEEFVRSWCCKEGVPFFCGRGDVNAYAEKNGLGTEEAAREMRYAFLAEAAEKADAEYILTAHNADDNAETVLLNLTRGAGAKGLCGIPPRRGCILRPMLNVTRAEIIAYLTEKGVSHREDSTNATDDYSRNRIRHNVIPILREINPAFSASVGSAAELLRRDDDYLTSLAQDFINENLSGGRLPAGRLSALPFPVASRVIRLVYPVSLSAQHVDAVLAIAAGGDGSASVSLPGGSVRREYSELVFGENDNTAFSPVLLDTEGVTCAGNYRFSCKKAVFDGSVNKSFNTFLMKCDTLHGVIILRPRAAGDRIRLSPNSGTKTLHRLFIDRKIPLNRRETIPVIADESGVTAIPGFGQDIRTLPSCGDKIYMISVEETKTK